ncbi:SA1362 family protein [Bacillus sp. CECT 9360]|uniref:SA1362 family protein n=1 Tax=Bacillus sp. CECT 9360 TaxID=2845821 RepID=UPI001EF9B866|nr:SA1362 family protein [Bacillus sp. CECT 9360]CAH0345698.1 hypothetical protein BCI9360_01992 [Bacillus sp. CECT 9360]
MNRIIYGIIALAVLGLASQLFHNPWSLIRSVLIIAVVVGIVYLIYKRLTKDKPEKKEQRAFLKAARQSKKRQKSTKAKRDNVANFSLAKSAKKSKIRKKSEANLTVIEGKKNKKKNRASF